MKIELCKNCFNDSFYVLIVNILYFFPKIMRYIHVFIHPRGLKALFIFTVNWSKVNCCGMSIYI